MRLLAIPFQPRQSQPRHSALKRSHLIVALLALVAASLLTLPNVPRALACPVCVAPDKITLSGDGIVGTATITDASLLGLFGTATFIGFEDRPAVAPPVHSGTGIELTRYYRNGGVPASFWTQGFDHMRYYPGAQGQPGYIFYEGAVSADNYNTDLADHVGHWYRLTADEEAALRQLLATAHANPQDSSASSPPAVTSPGSGASGLAGVVAVLLACLALLIAGVGSRFIYMRRHRPAQVMPMRESAD